MTPTPVIHVVLIGWASTTPPEVREQARAIARAFPDRIPGIVSLAEGSSVSTEGLEAGHDYAMVLTFVDAAARDAYLPHPVHLEFVRLLQQQADAPRVTVFDLDA